jgi:hypothetical protein
MATVPNYAATPLMKHVQVSTANTNRDGTTGTYGTLLTAGGNGCRIEEILLHAAVATTAGLIRLFINDGTNPRLFAEIPVAAITPSGTVPAFTARLSFANLVLESGDSITVNTNNAEAMNVFAFGGSF